MATSPWIGVDLDGTLAHYDHWEGPDHIGEPITVMVERVKGWLEQGITVKIVTARVSPRSCLAGGYYINEATTPIMKWCMAVFGRSLPVTHKKDFGMVELWDDRAVQLIPNTGQRVDGRE